MEYETSWPWSHIYISQLPYIEKAIQFYNMQYIWYFNVFLCLIGIDFCLTQQTADNAANQKTKQILAYIADLPRQGMWIVNIFQG